VSIYGRATVVVFVVEIGFIVGLLISRAMV
jgi:hypothetical protein